ncbi:hypothetical protein DPMN_111513 [Dreissena polymorpha]|uniref:Uncharacterized protein n=1 Tax=Dreissena polymorpha TaxID=45954 RepID=A0A9D4KF18_DREPO|nr:hypothetical protein DPMN_111513 [Dreissena polymorpha]
MNNALNKPFYRVKVTIKDRRHVILATDTQLELRTRAKTWYMYMDRMFRVVKSPIKQLFPIHEER